MKFATSQNIKPLMTKMNRPRLMTVTGKVQKYLIRKAMIDTLGLKTGTTA